MKRCLAILFFAWQPAIAQDHPQTSPRFDTLVIEDGHVENTAVVTYANSEAMASDGGWYTLVSDNGVTVEVFIEINAVEGKERITVYTGDEHAAYPVEADVDDGDELHIQISRPFS